MATGAPTERGEPLRPLRWTSAYQTVFFVVFRFPEMM